MKPRMPTTESFSRQAWTVTYREAIAAAQATEVDGVRVPFNGLAKRFGVARTALSAVSPNASRQGTGARGPVESSDPLAGWQPANRQTGSLRYEKDLTVTGQVLGTPNYPRRLA